MEIQELLEQVKAGTLSIEEAKQYLRKEPFEELGYAKLDTHRKLRTGHAEVIYCEGKSTEHFLEIFTHLYRENGEVFGTRASKEQYLAAKERFPQTVYDETSVSSELKRMTSRIWEKSWYAVREQQIFS